MIPELNRTWVQIVEFVRAGKKVRQKLLHHVGVAHNDGEIEVIKHSVRQLMEQLRADQTPQNELFFPTEYADLQEVVRKAPRPETRLCKKFAHAHVQKFSFVAISSRASSKGKMIPPKSPTSFPVPSVRPKPYPHFVICTAGVKSSDWCICCSEGIDCSSFAPS